MKDQLKAFLRETAYIHVKRLNFALEKLKNKFPLNASKVRAFNDNDIMLLEPIVSFGIMVQATLSLQLYLLFLTFKDHMYAK